METVSQITVKVTDFARAFLRWRIDTFRKPPATVSQKLPMTLNNVRMPIECRTVVTHEDSGRVAEFFLGVSCKSEQVWVPRQVWHMPNADMCMWASRDQCMVFKRWDKVGKGVPRYPASLGTQPEKQLENVNEVFDRFVIDAPWCRGRVLAGVDEIVEVLASDRAVLSQTEYCRDGYRVLLEYPVKTVNFSERECYYQVDTGPVLLPDTSRPPAALIEGCRLAYVAHNSPDWAELIVNVPTMLTDAIQVHHYAQSERIEPTINRMIEVLS